jgi:hypothetical protein
MVGLSVPWLPIMVGTQKMYNWGWGCSSVVELFVYDAQGPELNPQGGVYMCVFKYVYMYTYLYI